MLCVAVAMNINRKMLFVAVAMSVNRKTPLTFRLFRTIIGLSSPLKRGRARAHMLGIREAQPCCRKHAATQF
jgi:hypothetical protein